MKIQLWFIKISV